MKEATSEKTHVTVAVVALMAYNYLKEKQNQIEKEKSEREKEVENDKEKLNSVKLKYEKRIRRIRKSETIIAGFEAEVTLN